MHQKNKIFNGVKISAKEILDSKGMPTVEAKLETDFGEFISSVPSGVSTGKYEAAELRDADGKGVKKAIENIEKNIAPVLEKEDLTNQKRIDEILIRLDGTKNKSRLGANAILAVSIAVCRAGAAIQKLSLHQHISNLAENSSLPNLPKPSFNMIEGGKHVHSIGSGQARLAFQEFMIIPQMDVFKENLEIGIKIYQKLKEILEEKFGKENIKLSKEGAFSAPIEEISEAFDLILKSAEETDSQNDIKFAIDAAASEFYENGNYRISGKIISKEELLKFYKNLTEKYQIILIEDPFYEEDFESFSEIKKTIGDSITIFGDDLTTSNVERIKLAEGQNSCDGLILKPNQIGTVSETIEAARLAKSFGWKIMVANRAGETDDDFIADLAVGIGAGFIKSGAPFPKERMAKYNRLLRIEEESRQ